MPTTDERLNDLEGKIDALRDALNSFKSDTGERFGYVADWIEGDGHE